MQSVHRVAPTHRKTIFFFIVVEAIIVILYGVFARWGESTNFADSSTNDASTNETIQTYYPLFQDVHVMIFVGFGFLMTYLRSHSWSSVGINFLAAIFAFQLYILMFNFWERVFGHAEWSEYIHITVTTLTTADFAAGAVLITLGAVLGKVTPFQMLFIALFEMVFYTLNETIVFLSLKMNDVGGSSTIHTFGAYFGVAATWMLSTKAAKDHPKNGSSYNSNLFAMIGTIFLWMYWPSFNSALTAGNAMQRTQINTILSLIGSAFATFMLSALYKKGKFNMEDILNATLAGGVMMGASADMVQSPYGSLIIGLIAGVISTIGFESISGFLHKKIGLQDTAGVHNLHGLPGVAGGITSAIIAAVMTESKLGGPEGEYFPNGRSGSQQGGIQIAGTFVSVGISILGGLITGFIVRMKFFNPPGELFEDKEFWEMEEIEAQPLTNPYGNPYNQAGAVTNTINYTQEAGTDRIITVKEPKPVQNTNEA